MFDRVLNTFLRCMRMLEKSLNKKVLGIKGFYFEQESADSVPEVLIPKRTFIRFHYESLLNFKH